MIGIAGCLIHETLHLMNIGESDSAHGLLARSGAKRHITAAPLDGVRCEFVVAGPVLDPNLISASN